MEVINVENVYKRFGDILALDNVSFKIHPGDTVGLLGPNGSGKTTTIKAITSLLNIDNGNISLYGKNVYKSYEDNFGLIACLLENNGLYLNLSVEDNLKFYAKLKGINNAETQAKINKFLSEFGLDTRKKSKVKKLSKGMQRKLAIVRSLIIDPQFLILDEPFDGIDIESRANIINLLKKMIQNNNLTILITSHVMSDIEELSNRLLILKKGKLIRDCTYEEMQNESMYESICVVLNKHYTLDQIKNILKKYNGIINMQINNNELLITKEIKTAWSIVDILNDNNMSYIEVFKKRKSLSDIYLRLVKENV